MIDRSELEGLSRETLVERARRLGIERPEVMTRVELADEIVRRVVTDEVARRRARGWLGVARDLVAGLIEQGLHLPDAAALVRRGGLAPTVIRHQPPVATVTLAEIYAAQGHTKRALAMLNEVLAKESDHEIARALRDRLAKEREAPRTQRSLGEEEAEAFGASEDARPPPMTPAKVEVARVELKQVPIAKVVAAPPQPAPEVVDAEAVTVPRPEPKPAPQRRDQVALLAHEPGSLTVVWELSDETLALARRRDRDGRPVLRLACLVPNHHGAEHHERDVELDEAEGTTLVSGLPERSVLRGAVGYRDAKGFRPRALATELGRQPGTRELRVSWSPTGSGSEPAIERMVLRLTV